MLNFNVYCFLKQYPVRLAYMITKSQLLLFRRTRNRFLGHSHSSKSCRDQLEKSKTAAEGREEFSLHPAFFSSQHKWHAEAHLEKATLNKDNESQREGKEYLFHPWVIFCIKMLPAFIKSYEFFNFSHN